MSTVAYPEVSVNASAQEIPAPKASLSPSSWEALCNWLTRDLRGMITTVERYQEGEGWLMECHPSPLESVTTHQTLNGVRVISIGVRMNGTCKMIELTGTNTISLRRNAAGWPIKVEFGYEGGRLALLFSGAGVASSG